MNAFLCTIIGLLSLSPPYYICHQTPRAPQIDGKSEAVWEQVPWTERFIDIEGNPDKQAPLDTRLKMLWDDAGLYFLARLEEPHLQASLTERESVIFKDNDFEIFIDPDGDGHLYYEYEINALGTEWDLLMAKPYRDGGPAITAWDIEGVQSAVYLAGSLNDPSDTDQYWQVEIFFPWRSLLECASPKRVPREGEQWRINFSRVQWEWSVRQGRYEKKKDPQTAKALPESNWVWAPQGKINMHMPEKWGYLQFSTQEAGAGAVAFIEDVDQDRKAQLWELYYQQRDYRFKHGHFAQELKTLKAPLDLKLKIEASPHQYEISIPSAQKKGRWIINQEGKLFFLPL